jgi:hypothetical protein
MRGTLAAIAERAEAEALRTSRVLAQLDLRRARECEALARRARQLNKALGEWRDPATPQDKRLADALEFQDIVQEASRLSVAV